MEKRPNVFPTNTNTTQQSTQEPFTPSLASDKNLSTDNDYETKKLEMADQVYIGSMNEVGMAAVETMRKRTEEQIKLRDEVLRRNQEQIQVYQQKMDSIEKQEPTTKINEYVEPIQQQKIVQQSELKSPINTLNVSNLTMDKTDAYIQQLSQPQYNASFDVIPLPSEGKIYKSKRKNVKLAYLTTADENILTSPNLLQSGQFLEILINRKLLEPDLRYKDLDVGDRNAIMIWLRATSYGEMYPITVYDNEGKPFDTEFDLNNLKYKNLGAEPDDDGYFDFKLPISKTSIKFKILSVGEIDEIENIILKEETDGVPVNNSNTYTLEKQIVEVNGDKNKLMIKEFVQGMRIKDAKVLKEYIESIQSGVDLDIEIGTPGGGSVKTFLPLNVKFFWPDI